MTARPPRAPEFLIERRIPSGSLRVRLCGELDIAAVGALEAALLQAQHQAGGRPMVLDFSEVELLSSAAAWVMIAAQRRYRDQGAQIVVEHVSPDVDRSLRSVGLDVAFEITDPAAPLFVSPSAEAGRCPLTLRVDGAMTRWTVAVLQRHISEALANGVGRIGVELGAAAVPSGPMTIMLCAALRRIGETHVSLVVTGAPPAVELVLDLCGADIELPDRSRRA